MRDQHRISTHGRGQSTSPLSFTSNTASPTKQSFAQGGGSFWFDKSYDEYANDTRYTADTFDCRDSQLSLSVQRNNTGFTDRSEYTNQTGLTGEYTADTFRSNADERRMPAKKNAGRKRPNPTKNAAYGGKKVDKSVHDGETPDARDDAAALMLDMLEERSNGSTEDRCNCSQSAISRSESAGSEYSYTDFTAGTYSDASTAYSQFTTQTGNSSFNTFGFFSRKEMMKASNFGEPNGGKPQPPWLLGGNALLASIQRAHDAIVDDNDEVETQDGSIQSNQFDDVSAGKVERGVSLVPTAAPTPDIDANLPLKTEQNRISVEVTSYNSSGQSSTKTKSWLERISSFSKKKSAIDEQSDDVSPIVSAVMKVPLQQKNDETDGVIASDEASATNNDLPNEANTFLASQNCDENTGAMGVWPFCSCTPSDFDRIAEKNDDGQDEKNDEVVPESQIIDVGMIDSQTPTQSTMFEDQDDKNAALLVDLDVAATHSDSDSTLDETAVLLNAPYVEPSPNAKSSPVLNDSFFGLGPISKLFTLSKDRQKQVSEGQDDEPYVLPGGLDIVATQSDGDSTFEATGDIVATQSDGDSTKNDPLFEHLPKAESRPELDEISALTGATKASKKKGIPLTLPSFGRQRSLSRSKGISKSKPSAIPFARSQSARNSRQGTPSTSAWSRSTNSSAVSIKCGNSQREFHIPATVASSAMSTASSRSTTNARNIYAKRNGRKQGRTIKRLSQGVNKGRSKMKSTCSKKIYWQESLD